MLLQIIYEKYFWKFNSNIDSEWLIQVVINILIMVFVSHRDSSLIVSFLADHWFVGRDRLDHETDSAVFQSFLVEMSQRWCYSVSHL